MIENPPDFIIAGAPKCGSSLLYTHLKKHPQVQMSKSKEPNFYYRNWKNDTSGIEYPIEDEVKRQRGEATVGYFDKPMVPERITQVNPLTKIVFCLRNPVYRAFSHYWHRVKSGHETRSLSDILNKPDKDDYLFSYSLYHRNLAFYDVFYNKGQVYIFILENYINDPSGEWKKLLEFLDLDLAKVDQKTKVINKGISIYSIKINTLVKKIVGNSRHLPQDARKFLKPFYHFISSLNSRKLKKIKPEEYSKIEHVLRKDIQKMGMSYNLNFN